MNPINKILFGIIAAGSFVIIAAFFCLSLANAHLKTQWAESQARGVACLAANDAFVSQIARQNKAVERIKAESALRETRAQEAADAAQEKVRTFFVAADKLRKTKLRGDACKAADALLNAYLGGGK